MSEQKIRLSHAEFVDENVRRFDRPQPRPQALPQVRRPVREGVGGKKATGRCQRRRPGRVDAGRTEFFRNRFEHVGESRCESPFGAGTVRRTSKRGVDV